MLITDTKLTLKDILNKIDNPYHYEEYDEYYDYYHKSNIHSHLNGECISYNRNELYEPLSWNRFKQLPLDFQRDYMLNLVKLYDVDEWMLNSMFGVRTDELYSHIVYTLNVNITGSCNRESKKYEQFLKFIKGDNHGRNV